MAKKKQAKKQMSAKNNKSSNSSWVIAAIVVIAIVAFLVMRAGNDKTATTQAPTEQAAPGGLVASAAPPMEKKCTIATGIVPGSKTIANNVVTVTFKNNGRVNMEGTYFAFTTSDGKTTYRKNNDVVEPMKTVTYTVDLNQVASELGSAVNSFVLYPVQDGKACENQRSVVIQY